MSSQQHMGSHVDPQSAGAAAGALQLVGYDEAGMPLYTATATASGNDYGKGTGSLSQSQPLSEPGANANAIIDEVSVRQAEY